MKQFKKFRKKPIIVDAILVTEDNIETVVKVVNFMANLKHSRTKAKLVGSMEDGLAIDVYTLEGVMRARAGDWLIQGVKGEFYPCKADIFDATYEEVQ